VIVNPNGSIPSAVIAKIVQDIPLSVVNITNYIRSHGVPPYIASTKLSSQLRTEVLNVEGRTHIIKLIAGDNEELTIVIDPKVFGGNWKIGTTGEGVSAEQKDEGSAIVKVPAGAGHYEVTISAA
jgi:hypothetical protein